MPYIPFPETWPVYSPAPKLAGWLKSYAESMELNIWTSATITSVRCNEKSHNWEVEVDRAGGSGPGFGKRTLYPRRLVFAIGLASGVPKMPSFKGQVDGQN